MKKYVNVAITLISVMAIVVGSIILSNVFGTKEQKSNAVQGYEKRLDTTMEAEIEFQQTLHEMTHQKVHARQKWGAVKITPEKIDVLIETVHEFIFEHEEYYLDVLDKWKKGDFSNAVDVHNDIWTMQGGNVGKATRLLTETEEAEFIKERFATK